MKPVKHPFRHDVFGVPLTPMSLPDVRDLLAQRPGDASFGYVVTPNAQHVVAIHRDREHILPLYENALMCICDSQVFRRLAKLRGENIPLATGADLLETMLREVIAPDEPLTILGGDDATIGLLQSRFGLRKIAHHNPPMGFIHTPEAVQACIEFVVAHPARFVILALGAPQQEILAARIQADGRAVGVGLCTGGALHFSAGIKARAPEWMQKAGLEWLFRLYKEPGRLWRRVVFDSTLLFWIALCWVGRKNQSFHPVDRREA